jgi:hypothetical protein
MFKKAHHIGYVLGGIIILINSLLASYHLFFGELLFHTDIARDFLLMEDMVINRKLDLIGPRAGGIPGMFFGPIWYWITLPIFIIGKGNPVVISFFWYLLVLLLIIIVYFVAKKIFGKEVGFISLVLISFYMPDLAHGFTQSFGSLLLSPIIFFLLYRFYTTKKIRYFVLGLLTIGFTFQFQPAFAMLILLITFILSIAFLIKIKKIHYLLAYAILLIPFSTYIVFELRHNFLELRAFSDFLFSSNNPHKIDFTSLLMNRINGFFSRLNILENDQILWQSILFFLINIFIVYKASKDAVRGKSFYLIFYIYYLLFWVSSLAFKGEVWDVYHWAFLPPTIIIFASLFNLINKKLFYVIFTAVCLYLSVSNYMSISYWINNFSGKDESSWLLNYKVAKYVFADSGEDFGYFIYTASDYGYRMSYSMDYAQKIYPEKGYHCRKMKTTYLIYYPDIPQNDSDYWKNKKVNITSKPEKTKKFENIIIEKYNLNEKEILTSQDPNLLCSLIFR